MFSIFNHAPSTVNIQQENNIAARKPGLSSTRKPFADRKINKNIEEATVLKSKPVKTVQEHELTNDVLDFYSCSYTDTPENYAEIQRFNDNISSFIFNTPTTPPPKNMNISSEPDFMEIEKHDNYFESIFDKIRSTNILNNGLDKFNDSNLFDFDAVF